MLPFCFVAYKLGASYYWVNRCRGAWNRNSFDQLWQHKHYGDPITEMPKEVVLHGILFRVVVSDGLVQFIEVMGIGTNRIMFERDPHSRHAFMWYCEISHQMPACYIIRAYEWVEAVYGGSHNIKRQPV